VGKDRGRIGYDHVRFRSLCAFRIVRRYSGGKCEQTEHLPISVLGRAQLPHQGAVKPIAAMISSVFKPVRNRPCAI
jgi:hypothetical protein